jgi:hypothetical protein
MDARNAGPRDDRGDGGAVSTARGSVAWSLPWAWRHARKIVVGVIGGTVVLIGVALLALPGPGLLTIAVGLAILATEYAFARRWLRTVRERAKAVGGYAARYGRHPASGVAGAGSTTRTPREPPAGGRLPE